MFVGLRIGIGNFLYEEYFRDMSLDQYIAIVGFTPVTQGNGYFGGLLVGC